MRMEIDSGLDVLILRDPQAETGLEWWFTSLDGWDGTPSPREDSTARIGLDGSHTPLTLTQGPRTVTVGGAADCRSTVEAALLADRINAMWGRTLTVTRVDGLGYRWVQGLLRDDPQPRFLPNERIFTFSLVVQCDDPCKHGPAGLYPVANGIADVENPGTAPAWPVLHAENAAGITFVNVSDDDGHEISWEGDGSASLLDLDFRDLNPVTGVVSVDDAIPAAPGVTRLHVNANRGTSLSVECAPSWR